MTEFYLTEEYSSLLKHAKSVKTVTEAVGYIDLVNNLYREESGLDEVEYFFLIREVVFHFESVEISDWKEISKIMQRDIPVTDKIGG